MSKTNNVKIKKLRKAHIWPAVLFFIFSIILTVAACSLFVGAILTYFATERVQSIYDNVKNISSLFSESTDAAEADKVMTYLENNTNYSDAIYLLDENDNVIAGFGGETYDLNKVADIMVSADENRFYFDKTSLHTILNEDGNVNIENVIMTALMMRDKSLMNFKDRKILLKDSFWIGVSVPGNEQLLIRCTIEFYNMDLTISVIIGLAFLFLMCLPLLFLFINVLLGVSNQRRMTQLLYIDPVTEGKNWLYYEENAGKALGARRNADKMYAVVDIALMRYRNFCTFHGVEAGEALLMGTDKYLSSKIKKRKEFCVHNGRASFALLLQCDDPESCKSRVEEMLTELTNLHGHVGTAYHAGIYFVKSSKSLDGKKTLKRKNADINECYNRASTARISIPEDNPMEVAVFDRKMLENKLWEHKVEERMQKALDNEEFSVYIQPKYNPVTEELVGAEALVRWINEEDGFISPGKFIPIFEKNGFITKLDDYMISHVAKLQSQWIAEGKKVVPISVNVSRAHFANADLARHISRLVDQYKTPHHLIEIELTESAFFDDKAALLTTVRKLQESGFDVSMDDFGAGYSSLNSLKDLPLNVLKLDADFFRGEDGEERGEIVVAEAIALAKKLNMRIVAEGIEKKEQVDFLARQDCDMIQGFYFAKPMPASEYQERL